MMDRCMDGWIHPLSTTVVWGCLPPMHQSDLFLARSSSASYTSRIIRATECANTSRHPAETTDGLHCLLLPDVTAVCSLRQRRPSRSSPPSQHTHTNIHTWYILFSPLSHVSGPQNAQNTASDSDPINARLYEGHFCQHSPPWSLV